MEVATIAGVSFTNHQVHGTSLTVNGWVARGETNVHQRADCVKDSRMGAPMNTPAEITAKLVGLSGPLKDKILLISSREVSIGRDPDNDLWTPDPGLSRRHCLIRYEDGEVIIRDLHSCNGTMVNGTPVSVQRLQHQDRVAVGESVLVFSAQEEAGQPEPGSVEFTETTELAAAPTLLRPEDALYLQPERVQAALSPTDRLARDLNVLLKVANGIGAIRDREALEWQLLGIVFDAVPADRGAILHFTGGGENLDSAIAWDRALGPGKPVRVSRNVVRRVVRERAGLLVRDVKMDESLSATQTLAQESINSVLCVPLLASGVVVGVIYLDSRRAQGLFDQNHLEFMTAIANLASLALENVRRFDSLEEENRRLRSEIELEHDMVGSSARMREVLEIIQRVSPTSSTVLVQGESGTGKELVARAIHVNSPRRDRPFVAINCAALAESLLESELFGHEKGAFTGALTQRKGKIEVAEGGTLFLDEISELAMGPQAKLLRVLQEREFERLGGVRPIKVDVRVIAATNRNLAETVDASRFRGDLFYRLNVVSITTPPLRERREDILALAESFVAKASKKCNVRKKRLSRAAETLLLQYDWPGNVRELENAIERAVVLGVADEILPDDLPDALHETACPAAGPAAGYHGRLQENKKQLVLRAMEQADGYYVDAAKILGIHPNSLLRLIRNLGLKAMLKQGGGSRQPS